MSRLTVVLATALLMAASAAHAADGCGRDGWRGPWGHCHVAATPSPIYVPAPAPYPVYGGAVVALQANGCPWGAWRGPWGHCRDTPYHGRLPNGGWK